MRAFKILLINVIFIIAIFYSFELYIANSDRDYTKNKFVFPNYIDFLYENPFGQSKDRFLFGKDFKKSPVVLLGCSYGYGFGLKPNQTFGYKLSQMTKRPVYNFSILAFGPWQILETLSIKENTDAVMKNPDYVIYLYMYNHSVRMPFNFADIEFVRKLGVLSGEKYSFWDKFYFVKFYKKAKMYHTEAYKNGYAYKSNYVKSSIIIMNKLIQEKFPKAKFIVLVYSDYEKDLNANHENMPDEEYKLLHDKQFWNGLKNYGIDVFSTEELLGRTMNQKNERIPNDRYSITPHPTEHAWNELLPLIVKRINGI